MTSFALILMGCTASAPALIPVPAASPEPRAGLLVMAHGGSPEWDAAVAQAVAPLRERVPTALALGMADPRTLQAGLDSLARAGVQRVAVVRLFLSASSFLGETEFLLGLRSDPPPAPVRVGHEGHPAGSPNPLRHDMEILLGREGLAGSDVAAAIFRDRVGTARGAGSEPRVLLLAHGMGATSENDGVLVDMEAVGRILRGDGISEVQVATLREDWPEERARAEAEIRAWISGAPTDRETLVVPFRLFGFGPYAQVLAGLPYRATEGLLPHALITDWIEAQTRALVCEQSGTTPLGPCHPSVAIP